MKSILGGIFSREASNTKRQVEIDIARGLAVFFMFLVHVSSEFLDDSISNSIFAKAIDFMGCVPAAPVFMFVMGVGFVYTKNQDPKKLFKRGMFILLAGYILNFFRGFLPFFIGTKLGYYSLYLDGLPWYFFLVQVDILQFAGLAMIVTSFLKGVKIKEVFFPVIAISVGIVSPYLWGFATGHTILDIFLATIFGGKDYTFHPLFSWIFYPLMGSFFGWFLIRAKNKNSFYLLSTSISLTVTVLGFLYYFSHPGIDLGIVTGNVYNYFQHGILSNVIFCSAIVWWLAIWHFASPLIPKFITVRLLFWSKNVTTTYVVHWLIIGWCSFLVFDTFDTIQTIIAMIFLIFLTDRLTDLYVKIRERLSERGDVDIPAVSNESA